MADRKIYSPDDLEKLVLEFGFLPFFKNEFGDFSVEEYTPEELWFTDKEGPWEWKGPVAARKSCVYGKFFRGKTGFISLEWFPDFANYRRDGYDFDARYEDGLASRNDKEIYELVLEHGSLLSKEIKTACGYGKKGNKGFDTIITRLQMQTYLIVANFEYSRDKSGCPYGWGVARYTTPEAYLGDTLVSSAYAREPEESKQRLFDYLLLLLPEADNEQIYKFIG